MSQTSSNYTHNVAENVTRKRNIHRQPEEGDNKNVDEDHNYDNNIESESSNYSPNGSESSSFILSSFIPQPLRQCLSGNTPDRRQNKMITITQPPSDCDDPAAALDTTAAITTNAGPFSSTKSSSSTNNDCNDSDLSFTSSSSSSYTQLENIETSSTSCTNKNNNINICTASDSSPFSSDDTMSEIDGTTATHNISYTCTTVSSNTSNISDNLDSEYDYDGDDETPAEKRLSFLTFRLSYLFVTLVVMLADGLQGKENENEILYAKHCLTNQSFFLIYPN
jgi:hypothetical protein